MADLDATILVLLVLHIPLYVLWGWLLFRSWHAFWDAICFWFKPDLWSLFNGEYWDDLWAEAKLALWFLGPIVLFAFEMKLFGFI